MKYDYNYMIKLPSRVVVSLIYILNSAMTVFVAADRCIVRISHLMLGTASNIPAHADSTLSDPLCSPFQSLRIPSGAYFSLTAAFHNLIIIFISVIITIIISNNNRIMSIKCCEVRLTECN